MFQQVAISLSGGEVPYFEMDPMGQLLEMAKRDVDGDVACMDLAPVPPGLQRCKCARSGGGDLHLHACSACTNTTHAHAHTHTHTHPHTHARFLVVGGYDNTVRVYSLEDGTQLRGVSTQAVQVRVCVCVCVCV